jgi:hypothetical protein
MAVPRPDTTLLALAERRPIIRGRYSFMVPGFARALAAAALLGVAAAAPATAEAVGNIRDRTLYLSTYAS